MGDEQQQLERALRSSMGMETQQSMQAQELAPQTPGPVAPTAVPGPYAAGHPAMQPQAPSVAPTAVPGPYAAGHPAMQPQVVQPQKSGENEFQIGVIVVLLAVVFAIGRMLSTKKGSQIFASLR